MNKITIFILLLCIAGGTIHYFEPSFMQGWSVNKWADADDKEVKDGNQNLDEQDIEKLRKEQEEYAADLQRLDKLMVKIDDLKMEGQKREQDKTNEDEESIYSTADRFSRSFTKNDKSKELSELSLEALKLCGKLFYGKDDKKLAECEYKIHFE